MGWDSFPQLEKLDLDGNGMTGALLPHALSRVTVDGQICRGNPSGRTAEHTSWVRKDVNRHGCGDKRECFCGVAPLDV